MDLKIDLGSKYISKPAKSSFQIFKLAHFQVKCAFLVDSRWISNVSRMFHDCALDLYLPYLFENLKMSQFGNSLRCQIVMIFKFSNR
jgi:hypothetical protein